MAIDTYANLQTSIANWLMRSGDAAIVAIAPDLIVLFEEEARDRMKSRFAEATATATTISGTATVALPVDFMEAREVKLTDATGNVAVLDYMTPVQLDLEWPLANDGAPVNFTIEGNNLRLGPVPDAIYTLKMLYQQGVPALSDSNTTNWLLTHYPSLYLYGSLTHAALFIGEDDRIVSWRTFTEAGFQRVLEADIKARWGGGPLVMKLDIYTGRAGVSATSAATSGAFILDESTLDDTDTLS